MSLTLHYAKGSTATIPQLVIEEAELGYSLKELVSSVSNEFLVKQALDLPSARVPALEDGSLVVFETGAIILHLLTKPEISYLAPTPGSAAYAKFLQWLFYLGSAPMMAILEHAHPERWCVSEDDRFFLKRSAERRLTTQCDLLNANVADGQFLTYGFSVLDLFLTELARWSVEFELPMQSWSNLERIVEATRARPAYQRMMDRQGITWP
ncbi:MAG: hypothetical protein CMK09_04315 [Ponticaulis sp.]|nr:hypothetical protein [Ponticaulis sp.]|tara:strand:+ start:6222 stop:6851 length:630 start_codon:yes stop_codon:yes gene_type:complete